MLDELYHMLGYIVFMMWTFKIPIVLVTALFVIIWRGILDEWAWRRGNPDIDTTHIRRMR